MNEDNAIGERVVKENTNTQLEKEELELKW